MVSCSLYNGRRVGKRTYGLVLDLLGLAALERSAMALVLETLGSDQSLDLGRLGVRLLALTLGLDLAADDVLANLLSGGAFHQSLFTQVLLYSGSGGHKLRGEEQKTVENLFMDTKKRQFLFPRFFPSSSEHHTHGLVHLTLYPDCHNQRRSSE